MIVELFLESKIELVHRRPGFLITPVCFEDLFDGRLQFRKRTRLFNINIRPLIVNLLNRSL